MRGELCHAALQPRGEDEFVDPGREFGHHALCVATLAAWHVIAQRLVTPAQKQQRKCASSPRPGPHRVSLRPRGGPRTEARLGSTDGDIVISSRVPRVDDAGTLRDLSQAAIDRIDAAAGEHGRHGRVSAAMELEIGRGLVHLSTITRLEVGYSSRSGELGRRQFAGPPLSLMPIERLTPAIEDRAFEVQMLLADRGQHRAPSIPDLLIAATAEKAGLTVLAVDKDFDLIASLTGQPVETLAGPV